MSPQTQGPFSDDASHLDEHILLDRPGSFEGLETVVGGVQCVKCRELFQRLTNRLEEIHVRQIIARAAEEERNVAIPTSDIRSAML
jgi:hypothetical protein